MRGAVLVHRTTWLSVGGINATTVASGVWHQIMRHGVPGAVIPQVLDWTTAHAADASLKPTLLQPERIPSADNAYVLPILQPPSNRLQKEAPRLLYIVPWLEDGASDATNLLCVRAAISRGWQVTVVATLQAAHTWTARFQRMTTDVFVLPAFLPLGAYTAFVSYLIQSRQHDAVVVSHSAWGLAFLAFIRSQHPHVAVVEHTQLLEPDWRGGGHARQATAVTDDVDIHVLASNELAAWYSVHGVQASKVIVCAPDGGEEIRARNGASRDLMRRRHNITPDDVSLSRAEIGHK